MGSPILYFLLLVLRILLNFCPDVSYKQVGFFETLPEKSFKFVSNRGDSTIVFNLSLVLLPAEVDPVIEKRGCKENALVIRSTGHVKMILALLTKVITLYV